MNCRERLIAVWNGKPVDHTPLTTWCFGFSPPEELQWRRNGREVPFWYSLRMEHIHTLPRPWGVEDEVRRVEAWLSLGLDDLLEISVPWGVDPEVRVEDARLPGDRPVLVRTYRTPSGPLRHAVRQTGEEQTPGWVVQPDHVPLFEDFNIPRAEEHAVSSPEDVARVRHLYRAPDESGGAWFRERMSALRPAAERLQVPIQAWSAFGMDAAVWLAGTEKAILMAMDHPRAFGELLEIIAEADLARTELAAAADGVDIVVCRGWYSSIDFWSPQLFDKYVFPHVARLSAVAHRHGKKLAYVMTTGVELLGPRLAEAGVDVLYFVDPADPIGGGLSLIGVRDLLGERMTLVGGISALSLAAADAGRIDREVAAALQALAPTGRFVLHPVDAIFPDTPWEGVQMLIEAWKKHR
jgi:uroporphyrinogen-III decarboxylase